MYLLQLWCNVCADGVVIKCVCNILSFTRMEQRVVYNPDEIANMDTCKGVGTGEDNPPLDFLI